MNRGHHCGVKGRFHDANVTPVPYGCVSSLKFIPIHPNPKKGDFLCSSFLGDSKPSHVFQKQIPFFVISALCLSAVMSSNWPAGPGAWPLTWILSSLWKCHLLKVGLILVEFHSSIWDGFYFNHLIQYCVLSALKIQKHLLFRMSPHKPLDYTFLISHSFHWPKLPTQATSILALVPQVSWKVTMCIPWGSSPWDAESHWFL
jgi:hypothetical protein